MNIFDLVTNLRKGKLNPVKEIVRDDKVILNKQEFTDNLDNSIDVTTEIDCKSNTGKFDSKITAKFNEKQKESIDKIYKIVKTNRFLPNLNDSLIYYLKNKQGKDAKLLEENIKKWAKTNSKNSYVNIYCDEQSKENSFLDIDTVEYLTEFMMSLSDHQLNFRDLIYDDSNNIYKQSGEDNKTSLKIISSQKYPNKRVIIAVDGTYYSVFCEEKVGDEWELLYWDAKGSCDPNSPLCILNDNYKTRLTFDKRLLNTSNNNDFIVHDGTCGVGAAALCHKFLSGEDVNELKKTNHIEYIEKFVRQNSTHQNPTPDPQTRSVQALCWQNYDQQSK
jgi:hypothetical protein